MCIWERPDWPHFRWNAHSLAQPLAPASEAFLAHRLGAPDAALGPTDRRAEVMPPETATHL